MWKLEYKSLILIIILCVFFNPVNAQQFEKLFELYENRRIEQLRDIVMDMSKTYSSSPEVIFFKNLFNENGEESTLIYEQILPKSQGRLKRYITKKLANYYFAKGYYITAKRYEEMNINSIEETEQKNPANSEEEDKPNDIFIIQVGAFSMKDNAEQLTQMLFTQKIDARVVERKIADNKTIPMKEERF